MNILIIDDDKNLCRSLQIHLERMKHEVTVAHRADEAVRKFEQCGADLVFLDLELPDRRGVEIIEELSGSNASTLIVMITGVQDSRATVDAIRRGAFDYIRKPLDLDSIEVAIEKANQYFARLATQKVVEIEVSRPDQLEIVGRDPKIIAVLKRIGLHSRNLTPVLIEGESGTGKELVARVLHESVASRQPFVGVNCSAIVSTLLESELFGHERGSFTGAYSAKKGKLELAGEGTIFFDEIGDLALGFQAKLLRVFQEKRFERVGGTASIPLRARIVAATNQDLKTLVSEHKFREDLYYRLAVSTIRVPPLTERRGDIPIIARHLLARLNASLNAPLTGVEESALAELERHDWPGNVRQLQNVLLRATAACRGAVLTAEAVRDAIAEDVEMPTRGESSDLSLRAAEKRHILSVLNMTNWNISQSAQILGITRVTLRHKISTLAIPTPHDVQTLPSDAETPN